MNSGPSPEPPSTRAAIAPHADVPASGGFRTRSDFRRRLGYYLIGVAIGCVMAGLMLSARARMSKPAQQPVQQPGQQALPQALPQSTQQVSPQTTTP